MSEASCVSCGAPLPSRNPGIRVQTCAYCGSINLWDEDGLRDAGKKSMLPEGFTRLYRGATGTLAGTRFEVLGRVRYAYGRGVWDEWWIRMEDGQGAWLTEDDHRLALERRYEGPLPDLGPAEQVRQVEIDGRTYRIHERGQARGLGIEGQVPQGLLPDETYAYADGSSLDGTRSLGIEYDEDPPTVYIGRRLEHDDVVLDHEGDAWRTA